MNCRASSSLGARIDDFLNDMLNGNEASGIQSPWGPESMISLKRPLMKMNRRASSALGVKINDFLIKMLKDNELSGLRGS